jgi:hypothetical protein
MWSGADWQNAIRSRRSMNFQPTYQRPSYLRNPIHVTDLAVVV